MTSLTDLTLATEVGNAAVAMAVALMKTRAVPAPARLHAAKAVEVAVRMADAGQWCLSPDARALLLASVAELPAGVHPYDDYLRQRIAQAEPPPRTCIGQARVLFAADAPLSMDLPELFRAWAPGGRVGAQQRLQVEWEPYGSMTTLVHGANRESRTRLQLDRAFRLAVRVATRQIAHLASEHDARWQPTFHYYQQVALKSVEGRFPDVSAPVHGASLSLGAVLAVLSAFLGVEVPGNVAFTGALDDGARRAALQAVGGVPEKVAAASCAGVTRVIAPSAGAEPHADPESLDRFDSIEAVINALWRPGGAERRALAAQAHDFARQQAPAGVRSVVPRVVQPARSAEARRILVSWVSPHDPWGRISSKREGRTPDELHSVPDWEVGQGWKEWPGERWDGIVLPAIRHTTPTDVHLMVIDGEGREGGPSTGERARGVAAMVHEKWPEIQLQVHSIAPEAPVRDYHAMLNAIPDEVVELLDTADPETQCILNVTAGTDAMTFALLYLPVMLRAANVQLGQVDNPRFASDAASRFRELTMPALT